MELLLIAVQFQQLLPHGKRRPVSRTAFRVCPQQAEVLEAEGLKAREFPWAAGHPTPHPIPAARLQQTEKNIDGLMQAFHDLLNSGAKCFLLPLRQKGRLLLHLLSQIRRLTMALETGEKAE